MFNINFYNYSGLRNAINKTLTLEKTLSVNFNIDYSMIHPTIKIVSQDDFNYNYCYIQATGKYYFIDNVRIVRGGFYQLDLTEDVLETYKTFILSLYGTVTQSKTALYLNGANFPTDARTKIKKYEFENNFNTNGDFIMITTGV